jgi:alcohol dehydrogenase (cytochrome c)
MVADPFTGNEVKEHRHAVPELLGRVDRRRGLHGLPDGTFAAFDDTTFQQLWKINVGVGFSAPPMSFEVNGKQYIAILAGASGPARAKMEKTPEVREMRNQTMLFVFGL